MPQQSSSIESLGLSSGQMGHSPLGQSSPPPKLPRPVFSEPSSLTILAFPPNRDTLGGTAYLIVGNEANILIDSPAWTATNQQFLVDQGGVDWLVLTHRDAIANVKDMQRTLDCRVLMQEQEAYLLPEVTVQSFQTHYQIGSGIDVWWTPGYSPGSSCLYHPTQGGVLFTGRHLLPNATGDLMPIKTAKTFHWQRQLQSVEHLADRFTHDTLHHICPGANTGFLRGNRTITNAYQRLRSLAPDRQP